MEAGDEEVGVGLLGGLAEGIRDVATSDEDIGVGAHFFLEAGHVLGSVANEFLIPEGIDVVAARSPGLDAGGDMGEREASAEFGGQLNGPGNGFVIVRAEIDGAEDIADGKFLRRRLRDVATGPNGAVGFVENFCGDRAEKELIEGEAVGRHHDEAGGFLVGELHDGLGRVAIDEA